MPFSTTDFQFDFSHWLMWKSLLFWSIAIIGFFSALGAFGKGDGLGRSNTTWGSFALFALMLVLLGFFPIEWGYGTDRANYAYSFLQFKNNFSHVDFEQREVGFQLIQYLLSQVMNATQFMFCISLIYLTNYLVAIRRMVSTQAYWLFAAVVLSMSFTNYNINTMRAGLAISFIVLGLSMYKSKVRLILCLLIAWSIHASVIIPGGIIILCRYYNNTRLFYKLWILSIPLSLVAGSFFNSLFQGMGDDERTEYLTAMNDKYNIGFRIDFILYSLAPMLVGYYFIFKKGVSDRFYVLIYNAYLLTNMFWIFVIRANYSDRFAYLSWFLIPFILVYPLLTQKMNLNYGEWLGLILLGETIFQFMV